MTPSYTLLLISAFVGVIYGYSGGAPEGVCDDMTPKHGVDPQSSPIPYTISIDKDKVKPGEKVKITINGKDSFKGFLLQVRDGTKSAGKFVDIPGDDKYIKTINCHSANQNAATHKNSVDKQSISVLWEAPKEKKTYTVYATVAKDGGVYWVKKPSGTITVQ